MLNVVPDSVVGEDSGVPVALAGPASSVIDEIVREGAQQMLAAALRADVAAYCAKFPNAVAKITDDLDQLLAFYDFPAEHWVHLRTDNHRTHLRGIPPSRRGHRPTPRRDHLPVAGPGRARSGQPRMARLHPDIGDHPPAARPLPPAP